MDERHSDAHGASEFLQKELYKSPFQKVLILLRHRRTILISFEPLFEDR